MSIVQDEIIFYVYYDLIDSEFLKVSVIVYKVFISWRRGFFTLDPGNTPEVREIAFWWPVWPLVL